MVWAWGRKPKAQQGCPHRYCQRGQQQQLQPSRTSSSVTLSHPNSCRYKLIATEIEKENPLTNPLKKSWLVVGTGAAGGHAKTCSSNTPAWSHGLIKRSKLPLQLTRSLFSF
jgi:hypothetical protein